jgi:acetyl-CoA carboxylase biotin carboxylase subunit
MNTRLQVEHPITEMITGRDLVRDQLRIACGEELGYGQDDIIFQGHAIEMRINAEDPANGFVPSTGTISNLRLPGGPWVRVDSGLYRGMEVGLNYDPMLAKIIVWAPDRAGAIERMLRALEEMNVGGVRTSAPAGMAVLDDERFRSGIYDTHILDDMDFTGPKGSRVKAAAIAAAINRWTGARRRALAGQRGDREGWLDRGRRRIAPWQALPQLDSGKEVQS